MPDTALRILLLEDSPLDAELVIAALDAAGLQHVVTRVDTADAFASGLDAGPDVILADFLLPAFSGAAALRMARERRPDVPFIFLSGALSEESAIESLKDGATDYVSKQRLGRLAPTVQRALRESTDRRLCEQGDDRYRFLADAIPQIVWTSRPHGTIDYCNARWQEYTGLSPQETRDGGWTTVVHPDDVATVRAAWQAAHAAVRPFEAEHRLRGRDGNYRWHLSRAIPRIDATGRLVQWVGTATDIDDRRRVEAEHHRLLRQLDAIIGHMNEGLIVADGDGNVLSINAAGLRLYGLPSVDEFRGQFRSLVGQIEFSAIDGSPIPVDQWPLARTARGETFNNYVLHVTRPAAGRSWVANYSGTVIRNEDGPIAISIVTFRDVTEQSRIDAQLAQSKRDADDARELAEAANRSKDEFLATLSHELRTPLNAILGWAQLLRADLAVGAADPTDLEQGLATIERNARVQAQLIEDLLDVSRIVSGHLRLNLRQTDLRPVLAAAVDAVRPTADAKSVRLELPDGATGPAMLFGDPDRLQQVIWNLLANAVKFTPAGGAVRVVINAVAGGQELVVTDTGQGIAAEFLPFVFDRFRQADSTASRKHGGLGLGLAIVRHLVEQHGGTVEADSKGPGRGATIRVWLPTGDPALVNATAGEAAKGQVSLAGLSVVVVDDEPDARMLVAMVLTRAGATVTAAGSMTEGLAVIARVRPAVVVSDIAMPGGDGYSLVAALRQLPPDAGGQTPAIALTAFARPEDRDRATAAGFNTHLSKPLDSQALIAVVAQLAQLNPTI